MAEEIHHPDGRIEHPSVRHEPTDASFGWVLGIIVSAAILGGLIYYFVQVFFAHGRDALAEARQSRFPLAAKPSWTWPPEPRLEQLDRLKETTGSNAYGRQQEKLDLLNSFGATKEKEFIHVPIDRVLKHLANKLPARSELLPAAGVTGAGMFGLLAAPSGQGPLLAASALFPGRTQLELARRRDSGLINAGASNSGRLFSGRTPR